MNRALITYSAFLSSLRASRWTPRLAHRSVTDALGRMHDRYTAPTNEALIALAVRLQWITLAIECADTDQS
jgi:hypothetical protein